MRVLVASKFWYRRGGLERVMFDEIAWLQDSGHEVAHFAAAHPSNEASPWSGYFTPYLELGAEGALGTADKARAAGRMFWNAEAARRFDRLVVDFAPEVVHVHGIHRHLSPSILGVSKRHNVPVVQTLHDYHHVCPADVLLYAGAEPCRPRRCRKYWYGACVGGRCVRGSLPASTLSAAETAWHRVWRSYERWIERFISPSVFMAEQMRLGGWPLPCDVVPNAVPVGPLRRRNGDGFCVVGRLSREKGIEIALAAARLAGVRIRVAGEGPLAPSLRADFPEAEFLGRLDATDVAALLARSRAAVVPSLWFENASMTVLEAMAAGMPVVASAIGGIPEQVTHDVDGLLVSPGDTDGLAAAMRRLSADDSVCNRLGAAARQTVATRFTPEMHLEGLLETYESAGAAGRFLVRRRQV